MENKITEEMALKEFNDWIEANEFENDLAEMTDEEVTAFNGCKKAFVAAMKAGRLVVDGGSLVFS